MVSGSLLLLRRATMTEVIAVAEAVRSDVKKFTIEQWVP